MLSFDEEEDQDSEFSSTSPWNIYRKIDNAYEAFVSQRQEIMNNYRSKYFKSKSIMDYDIGEYVMLYKPFPKKAYSSEMIYKWMGPYQVIKRLGPLTYRIQNDNQTLVSHVMRLKRLNTD